MWDPLGWPQTTTKGGGFDVSADAQGRCLPCSSVQGAIWSTQKNHKNIKSAGINRSASRVHTKEFSHPKSQHKNPQNSCNLWKNLRRAKLTLVKNLES